MTIWTQFLCLLRSRKFWALVIALVGVTAAYAVGEVTAWQAVQAAVAALAAYSTGVALEDAGRSRAL